MKDRYAWKENYCKNCRRHVEIDEFEFKVEKIKGSTTDAFIDVGFGVQLKHTLEDTAVTYIGVCKECGRIVMEGKMGGFIKEI